MLQTAAQLGFACFPGEGRDFPQRFFYRSSYILVGEIRGHRALLCFIPSGRCLFRTRPCHFPPQGQAWRWSCLLCVFSVLILLQHCRDSIK